jgi:5-methylcytosine-specific restriction endonuclease McrA
MNRRAPLPDMPDECFSHPIFARAWRAGSPLRRPSGEWGQLPCRTKVSRTRRAQVYERDGHRCLACGATESLTLDHLVPFILGGSNAVANLRTLCGDCNSKDFARNYGQACDTAPAAPRDYWMAR